jgi:hypothetical protein
MLDKKLREKLWVLIEESKKNANFKSAKQCENLCKLLNENCKIRDTMDWLMMEFSEIMNEFISDKEFKLLYKENMGFVNKDKDLDFISWVVLQGKELYDDYFTRGFIAIHLYISDNKIDVSDYEYESMMDAFHWIEK